MNFNCLKLKFFLIFIAVALSAFFDENLHAQSGTTSISGTIFDQQRKIISGATATLTNAEKGFIRAATTNDNGTFTFSGVQSGVYLLEVKKNGFKKFSQNEVRALVDTPTNVSVVLEVGSVSETVTVRNDTAESLLNTQDATIGNPFNSTQVTQLPTEARNIINLLTLQPGVTRFGYVAGGRSDQANITLDGVTVNEAVTNDIFSPILRLNSEAIEEFRVTTTNANASQGRSSGAQISLVTKSGTNNLRGAIFLTGRRTAWTANDFFNNKAGLTRPNRDKNVFGAAIGGAIRRNRAFFFYSFEGERSTRGETVLRAVPLPTLGQGIVRFNGTNGQIAALDCSQISSVFSNTGGCNPFALAVFADASARYPANSSDTGDNLNTGGFRFNADNKIKNNSQVLRLDFNINREQQAFFRFNYINDVEASAPRFPDTPAPSVWRHPFGFVVGHSRTISKNVFNNFRYGLIRNSQTVFGDSTENQISFSGVYAPRLFTRTFSPVDPVQNITDDVSLIWKAHAFQFGANVRLIRSRLQTFVRSYDTAATDSALFQGGGNAITNPLNTYLQSTFGYQISNVQIQTVQNAVAAIVGRFSGYTARSTFERDGSLQPFGTARQREFKTEEYDFYAQDVWRLAPNLTATFGLRYDLSRPVYEKSGYEVRPIINLSEYFERRAAGAAHGAPYNQPIILDLSGTVNGKSALYRWDANNFQPRLAVAWSPHFGGNGLVRLFGADHESVFRGGFAATNDQLGAILAGRYESIGNLGFVQNSQIRNRSYLSENLAPPFTGFNQSVRNFPSLMLPGNLTFPFQSPIQNSPMISEVGFDENLVSPINYSWNLTFERTLPHGLIFTVSYLGRKARNLLQARDAAAIADFVDSQSGMDWNTAATQLEILRRQSTPVSQVGQIPYFANLFPADLSARLNCPAGYNQTQAVYSLIFRGAGNCGTGTDWAGVQSKLSLLSSRFPGEHIFYQPQFGSYTAWSSIGKSDYQGLTVSVRQRLGTRLTLDFNYTFSKSLDDGSGLQAANIYSSGGFVINPFRQQDMYAASDFDMRHIVNANAIFKLPVGRGETIFGGINKFANLFVGGWQLTGIFRYNSGLPISAPTDSGRTTNFNIKSYTTRTADIQICPTRGGSLFGCHTAEAYRSLRNAYPGETGERNVFRLPSFWVIDLGFGKTFDLPWENHQLQFRWEVFNLANTQPMGGIKSEDYTVGLDPQNAAQTPANFANFTAIQGSPRSMQFVLRYSF